jgi:polyketide synthase 12
LSGTNAHVVLEEVPAASPVDRVALPAVPWVLSGRGEAGLGAQARVLAEHLERHPELAAEDVALSLAVRGRLEDRAVVVGTDRAALMEGVRAVADGSVVGVRARPAGRVAFVFGGQGSQWPGMAVALAEESPVFAEALRACGEALAPFVEWRLEDVLADAAALERVDVVQPALWAVMVSLAALWRSVGVRPDVVVGHSQGEIAAATVAGACRSMTVRAWSRCAAVRSPTCSPGGAGWCRCRLPRSRPRSWPRSARASRWRRSTRRGRWSSRAIPPASTR